MTADEIRKDGLSTADNDANGRLSQNIQGCEYFLREIAAQLAELNENVKRLKHTTVTRVPVDLPDGY